MGVGPMIRCIRFLVRSLPGVQTATFLPRAHVVGTEEASCLVVLSQGPHPHDLTYSWSPPEDLTSQSHPPGVRASTCDLGGPGHPVQDTTCCDVSSGDRVMEEAQVCPGEASGPQGT